MISKTPQFDAALDAYFAGLLLGEKGGQWRICRFSGERFYVRPEDIAFYKEMRVPLPALSPLERACNHCGKSMTTGYAPERPEKNIYCE